MDQPAFTITSSATEDDYKKFLAVACKKMHIRSLIVTAICTITSLIIVFEGLHFLPNVMLKKTLESLRFSEGNIDLIIFQLTIFMFFTLLILISKFISKFYRQHLVSPNGSFCKTTTTTIDQQGVHTQNEHVTSTTKWSGIKKITNHKKIILFYVDNYMAHVFPKHAFETPEEATAFYETALAFFNAAQNPDLHHDETDSAQQNVNATDNNKDDDHAVVS